MSVCRMDDSPWCMEGTCPECDRARLPDYVPKPPAETSEHLTTDEVKKKFGRVIERWSGMSDWDRIAEDHGKPCSTYTCNWRVWCELRVYKPALASVEKTTQGWRLVMFTHHGPKFVVAVPERELPGAGMSIYCDDAPFSSMTRDDCIEQGEMWMARAEKLK